MSLATLGFLVFGDEYETSAVYDSWRVVSETNTDRYASLLAMEGDWSGFGYEDGSGYSLVSLLTDSERVALTLLDACDRSEQYVWGGTWRVVETDARPEEWAEVIGLIVYTSSHGLHNVTTYTTTSALEEAWQACEEETSASYEDDEDEEEPSVCDLCNGSHTTPDDRVWSDACEHANPLLGDVRRAESLGGTE